ncbi:MAG: T9SS type A sorting domain-containing protein [Flavobacteriales bacterium]|nr:T9SS type A sorting domain-containing protein [Flavobacteriales bacterium]
MARIVFTFVLLLFAAHVKALEPTETASAYDHLLEVNSQWTNHRNAVPDVQIRFRNENERIKFHLQNVILALGNSDISKAKKLLLTELWHYADEEKFPLNLGHSERRPYFIDHQQTHCAVGYLMQASGNEELAQRIRQEYNYDHIVDIHTDGVAAWAKQYGFTEQELAWIQPSYPVETVFSPLTGDLNGAVREMVVARTFDNAADSLIYILGDFDAVDGVLCRGLATYDGSSIQPLIVPFAGRVKRLGFYSGELAFFGRFVLDGDTCPVISMDSDGQFIPHGVPDRPKAIGVTGYGAPLRYYLAVQPDSLDEAVEIWSYSLNINNGNYSWNLVATVFGHVSGMGDGSLPIPVYGSFDSIRTHYVLGDSTYLTENLFELSPYTNVPTTYSNLNCDTIECVYRSGSISYYGATSTNGPVLFRYLNGVVQPLINATSSVRSVRDIRNFDGQSLFLAGDFIMEPFGLYFGTNLGLYSAISNGLSPYGLFSAPLNRVLKFQDSWYVGGEFQDSTVNYIARLEGFTSVSEKEEIGVGLYPNPTIDYLNISLGQDWEGLKNLQLYAMDGRLLMNKTFLGSTYQASLADFPSGQYILSLSNEKVTSTLVVLKQ